MHPDLTEPPLPTVEALRSSASRDLMVRCQRLQVLEEQAVNSVHLFQAAVERIVLEVAARVRPPKSGRKVGAQPGHKGSFLSCCRGDQVDHSRFLCSARAAMCAVQG